MPALLRWTINLRPRPSRVPTTSGQENIPFHPLETKQIPLSMIYNVSHFIHWKPNKISVSARELIPIHVLDTKKLPHLWYKTCSFSSTGNQTRSFKSGLQYVSCFQLEGEGVPEPLVQNKSCFTASSLEEFCFLLLGTEWVSFSLVFKDFPFNLLETEQYSLPLV